MLSHMITNKPSPSSEEGHETRLKAQKHQVTGRFGGEFLPNLVVKINLDTQHIENT